MPSFHLRVPESCLKAARWRIGLIRSAGPCAESLARVARSRGCEVMLTHHENCDAAENEHRAGLLLPKPPPHQKKISNSAKFALIIGFARAKCA